MPYGGGPKSGCAWRVRPMKLMYASDCGSIGAPLTFWFHQLPAGSSRRPPRSSARRTFPVLPAPLRLTPIGDGPASAPPPQALLASSADTSASRPMCGEVTSARAQEVRLHGMARRSSSPRVLVWQGWQRDDKCDASAGRRGELLTQKRDER